MTIESEIKNAIAKDKMIFGAKAVTKALKTSSVEKIILASNCQKSAENDFKQYTEIENIKIEKFNGTEKQLGLFCGKPFGISVIAIKK